MKKDYIVELREEEAETDKLINAYWVGELVHCKDCRHKVNTVDDYDFGSKCPCFCSGDPYYSWVPDDNWFCPRGERRS